MFTVVVEDQYFGVDIDSQMWMTCQFQIVHALDDMAMHLSLFMTVHVLCIINNFLGHASMLEYSCFESALMLA